VDKVKILLKYLFAALFIFGGINHCLNPEFYIAMMPDFLPAHKLLVYLSGIAEFIVGAGLLIPKFQTKAAWGIFGVLIAVFPANIHMYINSDKFTDVSETVLLMRLPIQFFLLWAAWRYTKSEN
jgi:uncharacterized membrane protein